MNPVVADTWQVALTVHDSASGDDMINVFHVTNPSPGLWTDSEVDDVAEVFRAAWDDHLAGMFATHFSLTQIVVKNLSVDPGEQKFFSYDVDGTGAGASLPYQVAAVISWRTSTAGKSFRGRSFIGPATEDLSDGRSIASTALTALAAFATDLMANLITAGSQLVIVSYRHANAWRVTNLATPVTSFVIRPDWATMRSRAS